MKTVKSLKKQKTNGKKVLLIDVDSKYSNLVTMKFSRYYKNLGYDVDKISLPYTFFDFNKERTVISANNYDIVRASVLFQANKDKLKVTNCEDYEIGGTGIDIIKKLPKEIDNLEPDYDIYPENDYSIGFLTRGCIRKCYFCFVPKKEGMIHKYRDVSDVVKHNKVRFLDNNILAYKGHVDMFKEILDRKIILNFNQGLDARLCTDEDAHLLSKMKYWNLPIFAFDDYSLKKVLNKKIKMLKKHFTNDWALRFFIYVHPDMDIKKDIKYRVEWCKKHKVFAYMMRDLECSKQKKTLTFFSKLSSYCNHGQNLPMMSFKEYLINFKYKDKTIKNRTRSLEFIKLYYGKNSKEYLDLLEYIPEDIIKVF